MRTSREALMREVLVRWKYVVACAIVLLVVLTADARDAAPVRSATGGWTAADYRGGPRPARACAAAHHPVDPQVAGRDHPAASVTDRVESLYRRLECERY